MDKETLKSLIISLKDSGMSYAEIAKKLRDDYNIVKDRSTVYNIYKRAKTEEDEKPKLDKLQSRMILYYYCLGYNMSEIYRELRERNYDVSYHDVRNIIQSNSEDIQEISEEILLRILRLIVLGEDVKNIVKSIKYGDLEIEEKKFKEYLAQAYTKLIREAVIRELIKVYVDTKDIAKTEVLRNVIKELDFTDVDAGVIKAKARS